MTQSNKKTIDKWRAIIEQDKGSKKERFKMGYALDDMNKLALIKTLQELDLPREQLESTLITCLLHIYKNDPEKVIHYLSNLQQFNQK
ncbi:DNA primase-like protein [Bacillus phage Shbh1]|uniref:DNA primase-like protein n=1 Tax=Bacillus phage Shbh1 TaxID=1796992 RepID=A0A142F156_9CAUD|nr:DNA primase-like protein [Bacillus phage Shbh1]AMQ66513.1 DNA primase-like protein [Bacillus phage Shbh1]